MPIINQELRSRMAKGGWETVPRAAKYAGVDETTVRYWIREKGLSAVRHGGIWFVDRRGLRKKAAAPSKLRKRAN